MERIALASTVALALLMASPAAAITNENGDILISQSAVSAGGITPGDTPGFPVTISRPGTYRLATNLTVTTAVNGIEVRANEVTIEMGGHTLAGSGVGRNGIASFNRSLRVAGGNVRGFTNDGIRSIAQYLSVTDMLVTGNGRHGIAADSQEGSYDTVAFANITRSKSTANGSTGILCGSYCQIENSMASKNRYYGIFCFNHCRVENRTASGNLNGILFYQSGGLALGNTATANGQYGIMFSGLGGAGNNTVLDNGSGQIDGFYISMQPNACAPACPPP